MRPDASSFVESMVVICNVDVRHHAGQFGYNFCKHCIITECSEKTMQSFVFVTADILHSDPFIRGLLELFIEQFCSSSNFCASENKSEIKVKGRDKQMD